MSGETCPRVRTSLQRTSASDNAQTSRTFEVIDRFDRTFVEHDGTLLEGLVAEDSVMESVESASEGARVIGRDANLKLWRNPAFD